MKLIKFIIQELMSIGDVSNDGPKLKYLELIQTTINRMANNSVTLKTWAITLVGGLLAFGAKDTDKQFMAIALVAIILFWLVDGYYLGLERGYRHLYDKVRLLPTHKIDFSMKVKHGIVPWASAVFSTTLILFYGVITGLIIVFMTRVH